MEIQSRRCRYIRKDNITPTKDLTEGQRMRLRFMIRPDGGLVWTRSSRTITVRKRNWYPTFRRLSLLPSSGIDEWRRYPLYFNIHYINPWWCRRTHSSKRSIPTPFLHGWSPWKTSQYKAKSCTVINLRNPEKVGNLLTSWETILAVQEELSVPRVSFVSLEC